MSAASSIGSSQGTNNSLSSSSSTGTLNQITESDFMQLLLTQLQNQNPLDPMSDTDFLTQIADLTEVGNLSTLNTDFGSLLQVQQLSGASSLIGTTVTYTPSGSTTSSQGTVTGLSVQNGTVNLTINNTSVPLSQVSSVS